MLKRELVRSVRRELRNLKIGQHQKKRENAAEEMRGPHARELDMPHMIRGAKRVSRREGCQHTHERQLRKLHTLIMQQSRTVNKVQKSRSRSVLDRAVKRLREPCSAKVQNSKSLSCFFEGVANTLWKHSSGL